MALIRVTSPHLTGPNHTGRVMRQVMLATLPGVAAQTWFFGWGNLIQILLAATLALFFEGIVLKLRGRPVRFYLNDGSAALTGVLLGIALPPFAPWWIAATGAFFAIVFAKQLYGGLGQNPFNPAMAAYALLLVSFPLYMTTRWATPVTIHGDTPSLMDTLGVIFAGHPVADGFTMATPLDTYRHEIGASTAEVLRSEPMFGSWIAAGWEWVNLGFLAGGLWMLWRRLITWHVPVAMLGGLSLMALAFGWDPDTHTPLSIHLLSGATMLGAFFIATDPATSATSHLGKLVYGLGIGMTVYIIRTWGGYPDAVAFSVLLFNFAAPLIDYYTQPRAYGHTSAPRGLKKGGERG
ncbi:electron transport complex subunit RsxD [Hahella sp. SMD15-11]|uniref:Ion-translocating oxidoreductase complex subunit D n=1 Tax=Thermohahella caldifontis TaxID=3142973 RepID=A0AB39V0C5_9GAMM